MTYKMNSSKEFCFKMPRVISQLYAAHITIYYLAFGWNSSLLTTLGKSCYMFHKIWVLDLFLKTLLSKWTHCYWLHLSCHKLPEDWGFCKVLWQLTQINVIFRKHVQKADALSSFQSSDRKLNSNWEMQVLFLSKLTGWKLHFFFFFCFVWICSEPLRIHNFIANIFFILEGSLFYSEVTEPRPRSADYPA